MPPYCTTNFGKQLQNKTGQDKARVMHEWNTKDPYILVPLCSKEETIQFVLKLKRTI